MKKLALLVTVGLMSVAINTHACNVAPKGTCFVEETNEYVAADKFFSLVSEKAAQRGVTCTVGRVKGEQSGRIYDTTGRRLEKDMGCLSHKEIKQVQSMYNLTGDCKKYTCKEI